MWRQGSWDTIFDTFCSLFIFLRRDMSSIGSSYAVQINTQWQTVRIQEHLKSKVARTKNGITERAKWKEEGKWKYLCKSHRYSILCPLLQPPILYIILQQKHSEEQTRVIENTHAKEAFVTQKSQTRKKKKEKSIPWRRRQQSVPSGLFVDVVIVTLQIL